MSRRALVATALLGLASCSGARASIEIEDARSGRVNLAVNRHVYVDVDLLAHDQLGGNIGQYCVTVFFTGFPNPDVCAEDLSDGDRKTMRLESPNDQPDSVKIGVKVRHLHIDIGRDLVGPVTPPR
jgi:hypothetical protein